MQNTARQTINLTVQGDDAGSPDVGDYGVYTEQTAGTAQGFFGGQSIAGASVLGAVFLAAAISAIAFFAIKKHRMGKKQYRLRNTKRIHSLVTSSVAGVTAVGLVVGAVLFASAATPNLSVSQDTLNLTVKAGESVTADFDIVAADVEGHIEILAKTANAPTEAKISVNANGFYDAVLSDMETDIAANDLFGETSMTYASVLSIAAGKALKAGNYTFYIDYRINDYLDSIPEQQTMQEMSAADCSIMNIGDTLMLRDERDDKQYSVRKMEDGNCWMIDNLRLGSTTGTMSLTSTDTNIVTGTYTLPQLATSGSNVYPIVPFDDTFAKAKTEKCFEHPRPGSHLVLADFGLAVIRVQGIQAVHQVMSAWVLERAWISLCILARCCCALVKVAV